MKKSLFLLSQEAVIPKFSRNEKWEVMNKLTIRFLCSNLIIDEILATALTFWLAFLHTSSTCSLKVSLLSIFIPKNFSLHVLESFSLQISTWWLFLSLGRRWNLSGFTYIQLFRNHKVRLSATLLILNYQPFQMECYNLYNLLSWYLV